VTLWPPDDAVDDDPSATFAVLDSVTEAGAEDEDEDELEEPPGGLVDDEDDAGADDAEDTGLEAGPEEVPPSGPGRCVECERDAADERPPLVGPSPATAADEPLLDPVRRDPPAATAFGTTVTCTVARAEPICALTVARPADTAVTFPD
jgi:hypothetical protein